MTNIFLNKVILSAFLKLRKYSIKVYDIKDFDKDNNDRYF